MYVNNNYQIRFAELMEVIDLIAFSNMDKLLWHYLKERSKALNSKVIEITETISRLLRTMEQKNSSGSSVTSLE